ncbi:uncharacterized protein Ecym_8305 [Eremothecium cymbalariae DBVPG|uniref:Ribonucleoside-diphosphate reductase n=1 Tax=Eremothecium cymbalariae (strain CBS 270.75 / DBVPG 7215 / KCTC 17166 / NRRL Y-17582) TaxID=931890 RepID=G8JXK9_ERECY|nr:Hypothetical protein Ecym_8305 [Eremothecium cymbalariae DBVPG\
MANGSKMLDKETLSKSLTKLAYGLHIEYMNIDEAVHKIMVGIPEGVMERELTMYIGESLAALTTQHPDFSILAARIEVAELHGRLAGLKFTDNLSLLVASVPKEGVTGEGEDEEHPRKRQARSSNRNARMKPLISKEFYEMAMKHKDIINEAIDSSRDYHFSYFGWKTLCKSYLLKKDGLVHETPQQLFMRVALAIHGPFDDIDSVIETYNLMSKKFFIHASPTLFNAGTVHQYLSSCFLLGIIDDSIDGIYETLQKSALISKASGGLGIHVSTVRGSGALISGSNGTSNGLVPMLRVFNSTARYVDQGGNKRPGAFCIYLEPWHSDIFDFLQMRKNHGNEEMRARDLFYGLWIPDLFMRRVEENKDWSLFSPDEAPGLSDCYGKEFDELYESYERELVPMKRVKAQKVWREILQSQTETGGPFMLYKDACNQKSNQKNLGTIRSSNLCCEIIEYSSPEETAVCNLASVALPTFVIVSGSKISFDYAKLHSVVKVITKNLDRVIDVCDYPVPEAEKSNKKNRPMAIGVQGFADTLMMLRFPFDSKEAARLNVNVFETIYHAAIEASVELAKKYGHYESFPGSPASQGLLQFDLWGLNKENHNFLYSDWDKLKEQITSGAGLRNSLLVGPMPTASTSQILGFTESFEPMTSMIYTRRVLSGEYTIINKYMVQDFCTLGIWDEKLKNRIILDNGSIQSIEGIPQHLKDLYKTVWELPQKRLVDLSRDRAPFIDQSQSLNLFLKEPTMGKLTSMHFYSWKKGLKTGMYYLRTQAASSAIKFTISEDNTLSGPVNITTKGSFPHLEYCAKYPGVAHDIDANTPSTTTTNTTSPSSPNSPPQDSNVPEDDFKIHDPTPLVCTLLQDPSTCESCSG